MTPNQREAFFAFDVERAIIFTKMILFFRGLCRDNLHCYMKNIYCGLHRGNLHYAFRREMLYYGLDSESLSYGLCRDHFYCGPIFVVEFTAIVFIIAFAERFFAMAFTFWDGFTYSWDDSSPDPGQGDRFYSVAAQISARGVDFKGL